MPARINVDEIDTEGYRDLGNHGSDHGENGDHGDHSVESITSTPKAAQVSANTFGAKAKGLIWDKKMLVSSLI